VSNSEGFICGFVDDVMEPKTWDRKLEVSGGDVQLKAELEKEEASGKNWCGPGSEKSRPLSLPSRSFSKSARTKFLSLAIHLGSRGRLRSMIPLRPEY
jgi:hypothetical protein